MTVEECLSIKFTKEEERQIEKEARELASHHVGEHLAQVCISLLKQSRYQSKLLDHAQKTIKCLQLEVDQLRQHF